MQTTKVIANKISSNFFHYSPTQREFVAEASELPGYFDPVSQVWNDAADAGFVMVGEKSDVGMIFTFVKEVCDNEGDIQEWLFEAEPSANRAFGLNYTIRASIIND